MRINTYIKDLKSTYKMKQKFQNLIFAKFTGSSISHPET